MKKYINPSIKVVTIKACNILTGSPYTVTNQKSDANQLSRGARFSTFEDDED